MKYLFFVTNYLTFTSFQKPQLDYNVIPAIGRFGDVSQNRIIPSSYQYGMGPVLQNRMIPAFQIGMDKINPYLQSRYYNGNINPMTAPGRIRFLGGNLVEWQN